MIGVITMTAKMEVRFKRPAERSFLRPRLSYQILKEVRVPGTQAAE